MLAVQNEFLLHVEAGGLEQRDLFRFVIANCGRALQRVKVIFKEALLLELRLVHVRSFGHHSGQGEFALAGNTIHVAGHQLQARVFKSGPALIRERYPALQITLCIVGVNQQNVIGAPVHTRRQIARLDGL